MNQEKRKSHIKKGDIVKIITGEYKGTIGTITSIFLKKSIVFIDSIAPRTKYLKQRSNSESKKIEIQFPIHLSNLMLWDNQTKVASRIGYKIIENKKSRYFKKSGNLI
jgi:large subunit ribosomal protein L24